MLTGINNKNNEMAKFWRKGFIKMEFVYYW